MLNTEIWSSPWLRPFNDVAAIDDLLAQIHPTWALGTIKARVVAVVAETADTKTFVLRPNRTWPGFRAGQHVGVEVDVGGVRHQRRYSLSSSPDAGRRIAITVKRQPGGTVSNWLHDRVRPGDVLRLGAPSGDFTLPDPAPAKLLLLAGGSGITPLMSMLRSLSPGADVTLVDVMRRPADTIFADELSGLAATRPGFRRHSHHSAQDGRFDSAVLARLVPDYAERVTMLCGPSGLMAACRDHWQSRGIAAHLRCESFGVEAATAAATTDAGHEVRCTRSERLFTAGADTPLLVAAEGAGLQPRYGCRMGICHSCVCVKRSGTVENVLTGAVSTEPDVRIQLCVSRARTALTLEL